MHYFLLVFQISENAELEFFETSARTGEGVTEVRLKLFCN